MTTPKHDENNNRPYPWTADKHLVRDANGAGFADCSSRTDAELIAALQAKLTEAEATIRRMEYDTIGVMNSVDKWLDGDMLNDNVVHRAACAREVALKAIEAEEARAEAAEAKIAELERLVDVSQYGQLSYKKKLQDAEARVRELEFPAVPAQQSGELTEWTPKEREAFERLPLANEVRNMLKVCRIDIHNGVDGHGALQTPTWALAKLCYAYLSRQSTPASEAGLRGALELARKNLAFIVAMPRTAMAHPEGALPERFCIGIMAQEIAQEALYKAEAALSTPAPQRDEVREAVIEFIEGIEVTAEVDGLEVAFEDAARRHRGGTPTECSECGWIPDNGPGSFNGGFYRQCDKHRSKS